MGKLISIFQVKFCQLFNVDLSVFGTWAMANSQLSIQVSWNDFYSEASEFTWRDNRRENQQPCLKGCIHTHIYRHMFVVFTPMYFIHLWIPTHPSIGVKVNSYFMQAFLPGNKHMFDVVLRFEQRVDRVTENVLPSEVAPVCNSFQKFMSLSFSLWITRCKFPNIPVPALQD